MRGGSGAGPSLHGRPFSRRQLGVQDNGHQAWALLLLYALMAHRTASQSITLQTYPVDWGSVPVVPPTSRDLTANCTCDLRPETCDLGCCCDSSCSEGLNELFTTAGSCLPSGSPQQTLTYCVPKDYVFKVNLPSSSDFYTITKDRADVKFFSELLCIVRDSNPNLGARYPDPPAGAVGDNANLAQCPAAESPPSKIANYQYRSYVYAQRGSSSAPSLPLSVPYPVFSSECNDQFVVGFLVPVPIGSMNVYSTCQRDLSTFDLAGACTGSGLFTAQYWTSMRSLAGQGADVSTPFLVSSVQYLNPSTGALSTAATTTGSYNATTGLCSNVVRYLNLTFFYTLEDEASVDAPGVVDSVEVSLILTDVLASAGLLRQSVKVNWLASSLVQPVVVQTSGNPGYATGFPVLAGTLATLTNDTTDRSAISRLVGGMPLPAPGRGGACSPTALSAVKYGFNASSTCSISLNAFELRDFCTTGQDNPQRYVQAVLSSLYPSIINEQLYLGIWGNSNSSNTNEWIQVKVSGYPFNPSIYTQADTACSGVVVGFDLQLVTGVAFSSNNLQRKVLYANLCFKTGVWDFPETAAVTSSQRFFLNFNVSFIPLPQQAVQVKKPAPPLVVPLPADAFYPFVATSGSAGHAPSLVALLMATLLGFAARMLLEW